MVRLTRRQAKRSLGSGSICGGCWGSRFVIATLAAAIVLAAGCTATRTRTATAADTLVRSADALAARGCEEPTPECFASGYWQAARGLAYQAHEFRQTVDSGGDQDIVSAFKRLWQSYHALRDEIYRLHDRKLRMELMPTTRAFVDVQRHVVTGYSHADPAVYASGGYTFDPYYN